MQPTHPAWRTVATARARRWFCAGWALLIAVCVLTPDASAQRTTNVTELERLSQQFQTRINQSKGRLFNDLLNSTNPAQAALNKDPNIELMFLRPGGVPAYYTVDNAVAAATIATDQVWPGGATGYNRTGAATGAGELAIWDGGGVRLTHQEFGGRVVQIDGPIAVNFHSTHVAGTMVGGGTFDPASIGMSYQAPLDAYEWTNDLTEMAAAAAGGLQVSNHSYGFVTGWYWNGADWYWYGDLGVSAVEDYGFGFYDVTARSVDDIAYNAPYYLICKSAGNDRDDAGPGMGGSHYHWNGGWVLSNDSHNPDGGAGGYDCIGWWGNAKNILTVGAVQDIPGGYVNPGSVVQEVYSSWGPSDDGRIKPDIVANGEQLYSVGYLNDSDYLTLSGTSMATPNASGSINILANMFEERYDKRPHSATLKALVINSADEAGSFSGPDYQNGWGLMNTERAANIVMATPPEEMGIFERTLNAGEVHRYYFRANVPNKDVKVTIAWTDPAGTPPAPALDPSTPMLVNDLDMTLHYVDGVVTYLPWVLDPLNPANAAVRADNDVDNVEQVDRTNAPTGTYVVTITHEGALTGGSQDYSLVWQNLEPIDPPRTIAGSYLELTPPSPPSNFVSVQDGQARGVLFTALKDMRLESIAMKIQLGCPGSIRVNLYEANGTTIGALLGTGATEGKHPGWIYHHVQFVNGPVLLQECQDYYLEVSFGTVVTWPWWSELAFYEPFDVGGAIRVKDAAVSGGGFGNVALPHFAVIVTPSPAPETADNTLPTPFGTCSDTSTDRGMYVRALETVNLCGVSWESTLNVGDIVFARIYDGTGLTRGNLIAEGQMQAAVAGQTMRTIPVDAVLEEGRVYDIAVNFDPTTWTCVYEGGQLPISVGAFEILDGEAFGNASNTIISHFRLHYRYGVSGAPFDLAKSTDVFPPPLSSNAGGVSMGMFVTALADQNLWSLGWSADVPQGELITMRVYEATGTTRGALLSEGSVLSSGAGTKWHDIPVAASLVSGQNYDFEVEFNGVNAWGFWNDSSGMNYIPYGVIRVLDAESNGNASESRLVHMRMNACDEVATGVAEGPVTTPNFTLKAPYPNPVGGVSTLEYRLEEAGPVSIQVYDVRGRQVATLLEGTRSAGPGSVTLDASDLPAGVYFVKMKTSLKTVSRKVTIVR